MSVFKRDSINRLNGLIPEGVAVPSKWLVKQGFSRQLLYKYVRRGSLASLGKGAFYRPHSEMDLDGILLGLQRFSDEPCGHLGGISALNRLGHAHYLPLAGDNEFEYWYPKRLPSWAKNSRFKEGRLVQQKKNLFQPGSETLGLVKWPTKVRDWTVLIAGPERAMIEALELVDGTEAAFEHASEIFGGLAGLRPKIVRDLLMACESIKAKRLFLFMAEYQKHAWAKRIEKSGFDLGSGKRQIVVGGEFDKRFGITIPRGFHDRRH